MKIIWDEPKRLANLHKHGFDFANVVDFRWETAIIDASHSRCGKAIGYYADGTAVVIFAKLGPDTMSIISFRQASAKKREALHGH
ncbi:hypothetical protein HGO34_25880 [Agrobacterium vitis]|uniref:BrnT family toxin n=1 Tax=Agrobacterium vitis TaxID=373 RepID=A0AAE5AYH1_AGRVI|nr:BrnT family toxin [Agrobacterium vitis]MCF1497080.1 hypothetical protein [Allorhizobium sp. Av2]MCM2443135.1 hypothetical protein [Agrobacterium vitis]MUZ60744.1 hypothetical protein [Agrobacterium vitis]MVA68923.1 hypothetical protein [Agrobacterium vitis]MVA90051.1 hypothetical protein [Agrobacterium vitis]